MKEISCRITGQLLAELGEHQEKLRRSYDELFRSRQDFTQILERVPIGIAVCRDQTVVYANPALAAIVGEADAAALVGRSLGDLPWDGENAHVLDACRTGGAMDGPLEVRLRRDDGPPAVAELSAGGEIHFAGQPAQVVMIRDLSSQRRLEQDLRRADRLASLGRIAANVAHEVNNPLGYMILNLERLRRRWSRAELEDGPQGLQAIDAIEEGARRIEEIVKELTALAPREGETAVPLDAVSVIDEVIDMASAQLPAGATIERAYEARPFVTAKPRHLQQVLLNLLTNAAQALPREAGASGRIVVRTLDGPDQIVTIEVEDNGEGIAAEHRDRVFKPFFTTKPAAVNTGLGLTISQDLLARMAGRLTFETTPGAGTVFRIELPTSHDGELQQPPNGMARWTSTRDDGGRAPTAKP